MRIAWLVADGMRAACMKPYSDARYVICQGRVCPVCHGKKVLVAHDIKRTVIFEERNRPQALSFLRESGMKDEPEEMPPQYKDREGFLEIRGENPQLGEYTATADAVCCRCRSRIGKLEVEFDTLFGRSEDELVLSGRYGLVI